MHDGAATGAVQQRPPAMSMAGARPTFFGLQRIETRDADALVATLSRILAPHDMAMRQPGRTIRAQLRHVQLAACHLADLSYGAAVRIRSRVPRGRILIHTVAEGQSRMVLPLGDTLSLSAGGTHVSMPGAPLDIAFESSSRHVTVSLPIEMWPTAAACLGQGLPAPAFDRASAQVWLDLMRFALGLGEAGQGAAERGAGPVVALMGDVLRDLRAPAGDGGAAPWYVVQARVRIAEAIRAGQEDIAPGPMAAAIGVGLRTLQTGFRRFSGRSFSEEVREQRLCALDRMLGAQGGANGDGGDVTALMQACGIVSTGRFAGYYRERFGALPSARLRRS